MSEREQRGSNTEEATTDSVHDCSFQQLAEVPTQLLQHTLVHIQVLYLNNNRLGVLPSQLSTTIPNLKKLRLDCNELTQLPEEIALWTQLEVLQLNDNWYVQPSSPLHTGIVPVISPWSVGSKVFPGMQYHSYANSVSFTCMIID